MGAQISVESETAQGPKTGKSFSKRSMSVARQLNLEEERDQWLDSLKNRQVDTGCLKLCSFYSQQGEKGVNQDTCLAWEKLDTQMEATFCAVFDGHGPKGHLVSRRVRDSLCKHLSDAYHKIAFPTPKYKQLMSPMRTKSTKNLKERAFVTPLGSPGSNTKKTPKWDSSEFVKRWEAIHVLAYERMERDIKLHPNIDANVSGSTATTLLRMDDHVFIANVGDSRAVLGLRKDANEPIEAIQLTRDHKCKIPEEGERVLRMGGRVFALSDEPTVHRAWMPNDLSLGLAVSRSFGDEAIKPYGVVCTPDVVHRNVTLNDEFIVLATDGIWDVLTNQEVVDIVATCKDRSESSRAVIREATQAWKQYLPNKCMDDASIVVLYLHDN